MGNCRCYNCFSFNGIILIIDFLNDNWVYIRKSKLRKRIAITPDIVKKYISLGFEVTLIENYGSHLGIKDEQFKEMGVKISKDESKILNSSDIIVQLGMLDDDKAERIKENQTLIGILNPYKNKERLENLAKKKINLFSL